MTVEQEQVIAAAVENTKRDAPSPDDTAPIESEIKKPKLIDSRDAPEAAFQIKLGNLSKHVFPKDLKKFLTSKDIKFSRCRKNPKQDFGIVGFEVLHFVGLIDLERD